MCLSLDRELTSDDVKIPLELSNNQRLQLRQGVAQALYTPAEYTLDGDLLKVIYCIISKSILKNQLIIIYCSYLKSVKNK